MQKHFESAEGGGGKASAGWRRNGRSEISFLLGTNVLLEVTDVGFTPV